MTTDARERSWSDGEPIFLFGFYRGTEFWGYTSADRLQIHAGRTYTRLPITRGEHEQGGERRKLSCVVTLPASAPVAANWHPFVSSDPIVLQILLKHFGEADANVDWQGRVVAPVFKTDGTLQLTCEPSSTNARRIGLRRCWGRGCQHALFSAGEGLCNVQRSLHALPATIATVQGTTITASAFTSVPNGRLAGGFVQWARPTGVLEHRSILTHNANAVTLNFGAADLAPSLSLTAFPGCNGTWEDCEDYYQNGDNFGGDLWLPRRSPFDGQPVY